MKKVLFLMLFLIMILGTSSVKIKAQDQNPVILEFTGDLSVIKVHPDAILIKNQEILKSYSRVLGRASDQSVILFEGSLNNFSELLVIKNAPEMRTETTTAILTGLYSRNGKVFIGQILIPNNNPDQNLDTAYMDFVNLIREKADKYAGMVRNPITVPNYSNFVFLPVITFTRGAYWDPMPILINTVLDCPFGKYNDVVIGQQAMGETNPYSDYWGTQLEQQILPGNNECPNGTSWYNKKVWNMVDTENLGLMYKYGPFSTFNEELANVTIGIDESGFSLGWSWQFIVRDVNVYDYSDFGYPRMEHKFELSGNAAGYTYTSEPGLSIVLDEGYRPLFYRPMNLYWYHWLYTEHHFWDYWYIEF